MRDRSIEMPPFKAATCPSSEVPVPKGITGHRWRAHSLTISATSSVHSAKATASGGTLDKLDAIPGLSTQLSEARLRDVVAKAGCAIVGATADIAPADKRLYAVRDVTATVESLDLITASILAACLVALVGLVHGGGKKSGEVA